MVKLRDKKIRRVKISCSLVRFESLLFSPLPHLIFRMEHSREPQVLLCNERNPRQREKLFRFSMLPILCVTHFPSGKKKKKNKRISISYTRDKNAQFLFFEKMKIHRKQNPLAPLQASQVDRLVRSKGWRACGFAIIKDSPLLLHYLYDPMMIVIFKWANLK